MKAFGMIEVYSFTTAVVAADTMAKAGNVKVIAFDRNRPFNPGFPVPLIMGTKIEGDVADVKAAVEAALTTDGPFYLRFGRFAVPVINDTPDYKFELGKGVLLADGTDVTIVATGLMVSMALEAKELLAAEGISARVINIHTIKPIDRDIITKAAAETGAIVTAEEHNIIGGLGAAVAETVCETAPVPVVRVGMNDTYGHSGTVPALLEAYGLTPAHIVESAKKAISLKK